MSAPASFYEGDVAKRWWALSPGTLLPLNDGGSLLLLFAGRPGGSAGPDVRDAVLHFPTSMASSTSINQIEMNCEQEQGRHEVGDVEFHVRASDWFAHSHHTDVRYNRVILHVVLICDDTGPTLRQDGTTVPVCSLYDVSQTTSIVTSWPCQHGMSRMSNEERTQLFGLAGRMRFEQKMSAFVEQLRDASPGNEFSVYDVCLIVALAEGLGYGRDRAFFRVAGMRLLGLADAIPEPLGRAAQPSPLDANRMRILGKLVEEWRTSGAWLTIYEVLKCCQASSIQRLRNGFRGLSTARADILICNVVLPFAAAVALLEDDTLLAEQARRLYQQYPGLPSNSITRAMCKQLQLEGEPKGACQQQGLHYIYVQTCREKLCAQCIAGKQKV